MFEIVEFLSLKNHHWNGTNNVPLWRQFRKKLLNSHGNNVNTTSTNKLAQELLGTSQIIYYTHIYCVSEQTFPLTSLNYVK